MRLVIRHDTVYTYSASVSYTIQLLRLTPPQSAQQRVLDWTIEAPGRRRRHTDAYGNVTHTLVLNQPHRSLRVSVRGTVEVTPLPDGRLARDAREAAGDGGLPREAFLVSTPLTAPDAQVLEFAQRTLPRGLRDPADGLLLAAAIRDRVAYRSGATDADTTAAAALALGAGVCQDHAHLFLAAARGLGVPARYVSGYIHPGDTPHVASHAWVDVWFDDTGWTAIDVTNGQFTADWHCRVAIGRDYESAGPVRGVRTGGGEERMDVRVAVTTAEQHQQ